jgi:hypothetical protein
MALLIDGLEFIVLILAPFALVYVGLLWPMKVFGGKSEPLLFSSEDDWKIAYTSGKKLEQKLALAVIPFILIAIAAVYILLNFLGNVRALSFPPDALVDAPITDGLLVSIPSMFLGSILGAIAQDVLFRWWYGAKWQRLVVAHEKYFSMSWGVAHPRTAGMVVFGLTTLYCLIYLGLLANTWVVVDAKGVELRRPLSLNTEHYPWDHVLRIEVSDKLSDYRGRYVERETLRFYFSNAKNWSTESSFLNADEYIQQIRKITELRPIPVEHLSAAHYLPFMRAPRLP